VTLPRWPFVSLLLTLAAFLLAGASPSLAGSICGTVRDAQTTQPVAQAAIFLFDSQDDYTGLYAGTDVNGHYCLNNVAPGTYTVQVRVNDYVVAAIGGVVVTESPTGVDVDLRWKLALETPWPNPASGSVTFRLLATPGSQVRLEVFDVNGRRVYGWEGTAPDSGARTIEWNLRNFDGSAVQSGVYFVRLRTPEGTVVRRFVRVR